MTWVVESEKYSVVLLADEWAGLLVHLLADNLVEQSVVRKAV